MGVVDAAFHCGRLQIDPDVVQPRRKPGAGAPLCARADASHRHARASAAGLDRGPGSSPHPAGRQRRSRPPARRCVGLPRPVAGGHACRARQRTAARSRAVARAAGGGLGGAAVQTPADRWRHRAGGGGGRRQEPGGRNAQVARHDLRGGDPGAAARQHAGSPQDADQAYRRQGVRAGWGCHAGAAEACGARLCHRDAEHERRHWLAVGASRHACRYGRPYSGGSPRAYPAAGGSCRGPPQGRRRCDADAGGNARAAR